jgi:hypothetical protein
MCKALALVAVVAALVLSMGSTTVVAQDNVFALSYFSNAHTAGAPDAGLRLVNDGNVSDSSPAGDLCASIYVFDDIEELSECCSCRITPNGILSLSVNTNLTSDMITGKIPHRGVIKVVSSALSGGTCDATAVAPQIGIRSWITHIQQVNTRGYSIAEAEMTDSTYGTAESADLAEDCNAILLVEIAGICSCTGSRQ